MTTTTHEPIWALLRRAATDLTARGLVPFQRVDLYREVWKDHPEVDRDSMGPIFQGMVSNAPGGPPSKGGTPFVKLAWAKYALRPTCPSWCTGDHLADESDALLSGDFAHVGEPRSVVLGSGPDAGDDDNALLVSAAQRVPVGIPETPKVRLADGHQILAELTSQEALRLAGALRDAVAEVEAT